MFHIENERLLKAAVSEEIRVECDKLFRQRGYEERGRWIPEKEVILSYIVEGVYYAAVRTTDRFGKSFVYAAVLPLCIQKGMYYNLLCNEQYEGELPQECQCPMEILLLLSYYGFCSRSKSGEITVGIIIRKNIIRNIKRM